MQVFSRAYQIQKHCKCQIRLNYYFHGLLSFKGVSEKKNPSFLQTYINIAAAIRKNFTRSLYTLVKSRNILETKRSYSSEDELTVKILISTMLMMQALIPRGLQIFQVLLCFLQRIMKQTYSSPDTCNDLLATPSSLTA